MAFLRKYRAGLTAIAAVAALYLVLFWVGITCPIKWFTGVSCPGCGMSRAWFRVLHLDLSGAWAFHPLFWSAPFLLAAFLLRYRFPMVWKVTLTIGVVLFFLVYFLRMFDDSCSIVVFEPQNSLFYRIFRYLTRMLQ